jgi:hypothetical protein
MINKQINMQNTKAGRSVSMDVPAFLRGLAASHNGLPAFSDVCRNGVDVNGFPECVVVWEYRTGNDSGD